MKIKIYIFVFIFVICTSSITFAHQDTVHFNQLIHALSNDYHKIALTLAELYPELIHYQELGLSFDQKPVYVLMLSLNIQEKISEDDFSLKYNHFIFTAGEHGNEVVNPAIMFKMIEAYAQNSDKNYQGIDLKTLLEHNVLHFLPMVNPDGHDLSKRGGHTLHTEHGLKHFHTLPFSQGNLWKSNLRGVDLNRNYPHYKIEKNTLVLSNHEATTRFISHRPSAAYYAGPTPGSEVETQIMMDYFSQYPFRSLLSFHSRGEVIFAGYSAYGEEYQNLSLSLAEIAKKHSGYTILQNNHQNGISKGYITTYLGGLYGKPAITIETVPFHQNGAILGLSTYEKAFNDTVMLPLYTVIHGEKIGFFPYRLYKEGLFLSDYPSANHAYAAANYLGALVIEGEGRPSPSIGRKITRKEALNLILPTYMDLSHITVNAEDTFKDTDSILPTFIKNNGIYPNDIDYFRPNDYITMEEYAVMLYEVNRFFNLVDDNILLVDLDFKVSEWAEEAIRYLISTHQLSHKDFKGKYYIEFYSKDVR